MTQTLERPPAQLTLELTATERSQLERCEAVIEAGRQTFIEVGNALLAIRDNKLYREKQKTFEDYCHTRWQIGRATAYRMMEAADVVINLKESGAEELPANQAQAVALAELPAEKQPEAWQKAVETAPEGKVTADHIRDVVQEIAPKPEHAPPVNTLSESVQKTPESAPIPESSPIEVNAHRIREICNTNSCGQIPSFPSGGKRKEQPGTLRGTFVHAGQLYAALASASGPEDKSAECWRLVPTSEFEGKPRIHHLSGADQGFKMFYHGVLVRWGAQEYVVVGPAVRFICRMSRDERIAALKSGETAKPSAAATPAASTSISLAIGERVECFYRLTQKWETGRVIAHSGARLQVELDFNKQRILCWPKPESIRKAILPALPNPFAGKSYNGHETQTVSADDRIQKVKAFTDEECRQALALEDQRPGYLQKTVKNALERRLRALEANVPNVPSNEPEISQPKRPTPANSVTPRTLDLIDVESFTESLVVAIDGEDDTENILHRFEPSDPAITEETEPVAYWEHVVGAMAKRIRALEAGEFVLDQERTIQFNRAQWVALRDLSDRSGLAIYSILVRIISEAREVAWKAEDRRTKAPQTDSEDLTCPLCGAPDYGACPCLPVAVNAALEAAGRAA